MWYLGTRFSSRLGSIRLTIGFNDLRDLFQSKRFCESKADAPRKQGYVCVDPEMGENRSDNRSPKYKGL